ncbi:outer membrane protein [Microbaculum marinum]|uniref:Outer membrane protein n=1 Tax=Microbaculum marinum TaxID=1764581 RepID=A0AAW9RYS1_9HYPH
MTDDVFLEPILPVEVVSSWYLRGDVGYRAYTGPDASYQPALGGTLGYYDQDLDDAWLVGFGLGYKFNEWFRTDVTVDYAAPSDFGGRIACIACPGLPYTLESGRISAWTVMANAYIDLGNWAGLTPYVGGGIGAANLRLSDYTGYNPPFLAATGRFGADADAWNFAWSATAGASYDLTSNLLLDVNYRYLAMGDVSTVDQIGGRIAIDDVNSHEFRVGLRYLIY